MRLPKALQKLAEANSCPSCGKPRKGGSVCPGCAKKQSATRRKALKEAARTPRQRGQSRKSHRQAKFDAIMEANRQARKAREDQ